MPDFNASAEVYRVAMEHPTRRPNLPRKPVHRGGVAECIRWTLTKHDGYPETYSMRVPLEAGFATDMLNYRDIEAISERPDFPG
jgi:hypothetical protein